MKKMHVRRKMLAVHGRGLPLRWVLISMLVLGFPVTAEEAGESVTNGEEIYRNYCTVCHGDNGDGMTRVRRGLNPPPRDFTTRLAKAELTRERMISSVSNGRPGTAMMSFSSRLTPVEIEQVVGFVRDAFMVADDVQLDAAMVTAELGKNIYTSNCAVCHGDDGNGAMWTKTSLNPPPRDFTTLQAIEDLSRERMVSSVTHGRPGTAMMSFATRLSRQEIEAVVDYVRSSFVGRATEVKEQAIPGPPRHGHAATASPSAKPDREIVAADMSLPFSDGLVGDLGAGREFYMNNCFTCHGEQGDGNGPRAGFIRPKPRNFVHPDSRRVLNRPALFHAISFGKQGTVMAAWNKVLDAQQIANVAEFVFQAFISPEEGGDVPTSSSVEEKKKADG